MADDKKFKYEDGKFINRVSGEAIPDDEPVMIFRARDKHALNAILSYYNDITDRHHRLAVLERIQEFHLFRREHPERMKEPGVSRHILLTAQSEAELKLIDDILGIDAQPDGKVTIVRGHYDGFHIHVDGVEVQQLEFAGDPAAVGRQVGEALEQAYPFGYRSEDKEP